MNLTKYPENIASPVVPSSLARGPLPFQSAELRRGENEARPSLPEASEDGPVYERMSHYDNLPVSPEVDWDGKSVGQKKWFSQHWGYILVSTILTMVAFATGGATGYFIRGIWSPQIDTCNLDNMFILKGSVYLVNHEKVS